MNTSEIFSGNDLNQIQSKGITLEEVENQLTRFEKNFAALEILAPATIGNGILKLSQKEIESCIAEYEESTVEVLKFVPASGAATRMFKHLFSFLENFDGTQEELEKIIREEKKLGKFFTELDEFAFYEALNKKIVETEGISLKDALKKRKHSLVLNVLLTEDGLNYGNLPKALLSFHKYDNHIRTATQEHLVEGIAYGEKNGKIAIHFTVSPAHKSIFKEHVSESIKVYADKVVFDITFSEQYLDTDTIAATTSFGPFRDEEENLLFRPAGHGALLKNLDELSSDLIFIKNIDNVVPDHLKRETIKYKKALAGLLLSFQNRVFKLLRDHDEGIDIQEEAHKLLPQLGVRGDFSKDEIVELLNRPIRVCGMVRNEGEPGGGPFWVNGKTSQSLQIVESAQVDKSNVNQQKIFTNSTHFNPVDIVCGVKNYRGEKFRLLDFRDEEAGFITEKSYNGQKLLAMELPGLWNGGMANWNTIFVEVPLITFNPVKTVTDLLKPTHR